MARGTLDNSFWTEQFPKWGGAAAMLGGVLCVLASFLHNLQPAGCLGWDCQGSFRPMSWVVTLAGSAASILIAAGIAGLLLLARQSGRHLRLAAVGMILVAVGFALMLAGALIQALLFNGDFPGMPFVVLPGLLGIVVGLLLIGIFIFRSRVLPRWLGICFIVSSVALVAVNDQSAGVLFAIPFGLAMVTAGYYMWTGGTSYATAPAKDRKGVGGLA